MLCKKTRIEKVGLAWRCSTARQAYILSVRRLDRWSRAQRQSADWFPSAKDRPSRILVCNPIRLAVFVMQIIQSYARFQYFPPRFQSNSVAANAVS